MSLSTGKVSYITDVALCYKCFNAASEYRSWTLFYAIPVMRGILNEDYFQHYILFSEALWLLLQSCITIEDIVKAERLLQHFCLKFGALYGKIIE